MKTDVFIPTYQSANCIGKSLDAINKSEAKSDSIHVSSSMMIKKRCKKRLLKTVNKKCNKYSRNLTFRSGRYSLPQDRWLCIKEVNEDWFLFLEDDVRVGPQYLAS